MDWKKGDLLVCKNPTQYLVKGGIYIIAGISSASTTLRLEGFPNALWQRSRFEFYMTAEDTEKNRETYLSGPAETTGSPDAGPDVLAQAGAKTASEVDAQATAFTSSRTHYLRNFQAILQKMLETTTAKNADYASGADAFQNFRNVEQMGLCSVEVGILTRMSDKFQRVANLMKREAQVKTESVEDTLTDLAVYSVILLCYLKTKAGPVPKQYIKDLDTGQVMPMPEGSDYALGRYPQV